MVNVFSRLAFPRAHVHLTFNRLPIERFFFEMMQGSLHFTPEHCLVNGGVPLFLVLKKQHVSNGCNMYLLRNPVMDSLVSAKLA